MTIHSLYIAEFNDIAAIRLECRSCPTVISWPLAPRRALPYECPSCGEMLLGRESVARLALTKLVEGLEGLQQPAAAEKVNVRLEFQKPAA